MKLFTAIMSLLARAAIAVPIDQFTLTEAPAIIPVSLSMRACWKACFLEEPKCPNTMV